MICTWNKIRTKALSQLIYTFWFQFNRVAFKIEATFSNTSIYSCKFTKFTVALSTELCILPLPYFHFILSSHYNKNCKQSTFKQIWSSKVYQCPHNILPSFYMIICHSVPLLKDQYFSEILFPWMCQIIYKFHTPRD